MSTSSLLHARPSARATDNLPPQTRTGSVVITQLGRTLGAAAGRCRGSRMRRLTRSVASEFQRLGMTRFFDSHNPWASDAIQPFLHPHHRSAARHHGAMATLLERCGMTLRLVLFTSICLAIINASDGYQWVDAFNWLALTATAVMLVVVRQSAIRAATRFQSTVVRGLGREHSGAGATRFFVS